MKYVVINGCAVIDTKVFCRAKKKGLTVTKEKATKSGTDINYIFASCNQKMA